MSILKKVYRAFVAVPPKPVEQEGDVLPVNYKKIQRTEQEIHNDAQYAINIAKSYVASFPNGVSDLSGKSVIEFGPGINFGTVFVLRAMGAAAVSVADRFLVDFQPDYHVPLYREIGRLIKESIPLADTTVFESAVERGHAPEIVNQFHSSLEEMAALDFSADITLSNAVFEHLLNPACALDNLFRITTENGMGSHQVDFRDHRDFSLPLEYLLMHEIDFAREFDARHGECGGRVRPCQMLEMFKHSGFSGVSFQCNMWAEDDYFESFVARLPKYNLFNSLSQDDLRQISGRFVIRK